MKQLSILEAIAEGERLRDEDLKRAIDHAEREIPDWKERIWNLFLKWIESKPKGFSFLNEDFRLYVELKGLIESPPSLRSFGFICPKAARLGLIKGIGTAKVSNPKAHRANSGVWEKL